MTRNNFLLLFSILILVITLTQALSPNISSAQDERDAEGQEHDHEKPVNESSEAGSVHQEQTEEHSSPSLEHEEEQHAHTHEAAEGPHVHNSLTAESAEWVGVGTLITGAAVFGVRARSTNKLLYKYIVFAVSVGVGIVHILLSPDHLIDVSIGHAIFFTVAGLAQIGFGIIFMVRPLKNLAIVGAAGNIGSIILYFATRAENLPEPFGAPEGIDLVGIIAKVLEMTLVVILIHLAVYLRKRSSAAIQI